MIALDGMGAAQKNGCGTDVVFGGGGNPIHIIRSATLDTCSEEKAIYQKWRLRDHKDW